MTGAVHAVYFHAPQYLETGVVLAIAKVGGLLPASRISQSVKLFGSPFQLFAYRGLTHSLVGVIVMAPLIAFPHLNIAAAALLGGYISHLLTAS